MVTIDRSLVLHGVVALAGVVVLGFGAAVLRAGQVGVDPYTAANIGISGLLGLSLGVYQVLSNIVLFIPVLLLDRDYVGIGTIIELFSGPTSAVVGPHPALWLQVVLFVVGVVIVTFGASAYMSAGVGTAPYDAIAPMIVERTRFPYRVVRTVQDLAFLGLALLIGGPVGVGTVMTAFFAGPLIGFFTRRVNEPLIGRLAGSRPSEQR